jgi:hypothetical protein
MPKPLMETMKLLQGGMFLDTCADMLAETVKAVEDTGKAGKLVITLSLTKSNGALAIVSNVTNKVPEPKADADLLWATVEGNLTQQNPNQRSLDLRGVDAPARVVRDVDTSRPAAQAAG